MNEPEKENLICNLKFGISSNSLTAQEYTSWNCLLTSRINAQFILVFHMIQTLFLKYIWRWDEKATMAFGKRVGSNRPF
jgi:hypothetical protein